VGAENWDWLQRAACRGETEPFFSRGKDNLAHARELCQGCVVRTECLAYALSDPELEGVWAGLTAKQRQQIRRRRVA